MEKVVIREKTVKEIKHAAKKLMDEGLKPNGKLVRYSKADWFVETLLGESVSAARAAAEEAKSPLMEHFEAAMRVLNC